MLCEERGLEELKASVKASWKFYLIVESIWIFYLPFSLNMSRDLAGLMILGVIINIVASITIAMFFKRTRTELGE